MSKGTEAISILRSYFGERVDPGKALALIFAKLEQQNEIIARLKNMLCGGALADGMLVNAIDRGGGIGHEVDRDGQSDGQDDAIALLALPRCELRAEVVEPNQPPPRIIT